MGGAAFLLVRSNYFEYMANMIRDMANMLLALGSGSVLPLRCRCLSLDLSRPVGLFLVLPIPFPLHGRWVGLEECRILMIESQVTKKIPEIRIGLCQCHSTR